MTELSVAICVVAYMALQVDVFLVVLSLPVR